MTGRHGVTLPAAPFARRSGRHRRRWLSGSRASRPVAAPVADDFTRPRSAPVGLAPFPMAARDYLRPYSPKDMS